MKGEYSYCETVAAFVWHIRQLTSIGKKHGGGADTKALCGAPVSWDVNHAAPRIDDFTHGGDGGLCFKCKAAFKELTDKG